MKEFYTPPHNSVRVLHYVSGCISTGAAEREKSDMSERTDSGRSSVSATSGDSTLVGLQKKDKPGFMTEVSMAKSVTIKTPHKDGRF